VGSNLGMSTETKHYLIQNYIFLKNKNHGIFHLKQLS
jgi:hypothetical protein